MTLLLEKIMKEREERKKKSVEQMIKEIHDARKQVRLTIEELFKS